MPESKLTKSAKVLLEYFQTFPAGEPITTAQKEIATATNLSRRTVQNALEQLEKAGEIRIVSNKVEGAQNLYFVNCAPPATFVSKDFTPKANAVLKNYIPIPYNKAVAAMTIMDSKGSKTDIAGNMIIETKGVKMQIANFADVSAAFNISTSKLLIAGIIRFTQLNNIGDMRYNRTKTEILIPVEEYALLCGYDVEERLTNTQDEERKEKNRVKNLLKYVRKEIDKDLELLYNASVSFKTNNGDYADIRIITKKGITNRGKYIQMRFEEDFAKSLKVCRVSMFPVNLFKVKNPVAFRIGVAMSNHYNNDNNLIAGTADRMKIETLLEYSGLPTLGEVRRLKGSWRQKIQKPFEDALEILHHESMLDNYSYVQTGGIEISELNADSDYYKIDADYQFPDFETWAGLLVKFKLHEAIDHTERIEQKQAEKEEAKANKKKKVGRPKKEIDSTTPTTPKRKRGRPKKTES